ncbi:MAG: coproporphyrinogen dehydrogenase HemZ [Clostridia bacterium]|nr:coproporphyrinogen dehydrogenase HemZ [Clostridia bacterium]
MEVKISGHQFEYDITGMCLLFFPGEPVKFVKRAMDPVWLSSRVVESKVGPVARATYYSGTKIYRCTKRVQGPQKDDLLAAVKYAVFQVFHRATGISPPWGILTGIKPTGVYRRILAEKGPAATRQFLLKEYCMQPEKIPLLHQICKVMETVQTDPSKEASLYVSIPFCPSRCSYCSFVSIAAEKSHRLIDPYLEYLAEEIQEKCAVLKENGLRIKSVYIGGGTPGILNVDQMRRLLTVIQDHVEGPLAEFTVELGRPDTATPEKLRLLKDFNVTRVCINTQTTNDEVLERVGRKHTRAQYFDAVSLTRTLDFDSINTDLIAGLPGESEESFAKSLEDVLSLGVDNVTIHTLSIKRSAKLHDSKENFDPSNDHVQRMLDRAYERLLSAGYVPYYMYRQKNTVSNGENIGFSKPETIGLYNLYMMEDLHTVAACGAGASSKLIFAPNGRIERIINMKYPYEYINENERIRQNTRLLDQKIKERI